MSPKESQQLVYTTQLISFLTSQYQDEIKITGANFSWKFDWNSPYLGAGATFLDNTYSIVLLGGTVRSTGSDFDVLSVTLCHEIGHILGGAPHQRFGDQLEEDWSSAEGQSDWFAASQCLPKVFQHFKEVGLINVSPSFAENSTCQKTARPLMCEWIRNASQKFSDSIYEIYIKSDGVTPRPMLSLDAPEVVQNTLVGTYPSPQCRLDTLKRGALCASKSVTDDFCQRPVCWFARQQ